MSQEAIDVLRVAFEEFARGDFSAYEQLPDDYELVLASEMPDAGTYRGEAARRWHQAWVDSFARLTFEAVDFIDAGDQVVIEFIQRGWFADARTPVELRTWSVMTVRSGNLARSELYLRHGDALEAAGLAK